MFCFYSLKMSCQYVGDYQRQKISLTRGFLQLCWSRYPVSLDSLQSGYSNKGSVPLGHIILPAGNIKEVWTISKFCFLFLRFREFGASPPSRWTIPGFNTEDRVKILKTLQRKESITPLNCFSGVFDRKFIGWIQSISPSSNSMDPIHGLILPLPSMYGICTYMNGWSLW